MTPGNWIAVASAAIAFAGLAIGLVVLAVQVAFRFGEHHNRLSAVEKKAEGIDASSSALAVLTATVGGIDKRLEEVGQDVKNLLTGRIRPASRKSDGE